MSPVFATDPLLLFDAMPADAMPADFAALGLTQPLLRAAAAAGWARPSAVQALALPPLLQGRDACVQAPTGAGKTGAFLLPVLQRLLADGAALALRPRPVRALVLAPTREIAAQTAAAAQALAPLLKVVLAVGGVSINPQMLALRGGADMVLATPGRLLELTRCNALNLRALDILVLDEADRLLDMAFADETRRVLALAPRQRQTLLFSATLDAAVRAAVQRCTRNPLWLNADGPAPAAASATASGTASATASGTASAFVDAAVDGGADGVGAGAAAPAAAAIEQRVFVVDSAQRGPALRHLLRSAGWSRVLVFVATQYMAGMLADKLRRAGFAAAELHGRLSPGARAGALADLRAGGLRVLVATDLAARGVDVPALPVVLNFDLPRSPTDYTHRIGRTGRAGMSGLAISFVLADAPGSEALFRLIEKRQGQRVPRAVLPGFEPQASVRAGAESNHADDANSAALRPDPNGGIKGRRPSKKDKLRAAAAAEPG